MMMTKKTKTSPIGASPAGRGTLATTTRNALLSTSIALAILLPALLASAAAPPAAAQSSTIQRTADGRVVTHDEKPLQGAIVYLKDTRTLAVKTFIADDAGHFHFGQLSQNTDYEIWAELSGHRSKTRSISSFDNKNSFNFTLTLDTN